MFNHRTHKDVLRHIADMLTFRDANRFVRTCRLFRDATQSELTAKKIFYYAIYGQPEAAIKLINADPKLLLQRKTFIDASGIRTYVNRTIGQFVLSSEDKDFWKQLEPLYDRLPNGQQIKLQHFDEQFPEPLQELVNTYDFNPLVTAFNSASDTDAENAVMFSEKISNLSIALAKFRRDVSQEVKLTSGRDSTVAVLRAALSVYAANYYSWHAPKLRLFSIQVLGVLVDLLPISHLQRCIQGLTNFFKPLDRTVTATFFPRNSQNRLGVNMLNDCFFGGVQDKWRVTLMGSETGSRLLELIDQLITLELKGLQSLCISDRPSKKRRLV